ncbi:flagellar biosynthesis anti-sigma factor FlgM [Aestuariibacter sp. A3R04]|uniref:flagellar biosynthesis anti-sigma factor FlgM n=1 Tax=Aestuariibacter sp. A3R04 TaxID=2841571 RepID=UPI001C094DDF|nr:flagellar biosynthesis anti-sigma factor FlgM [Aestuariibacter sp. A3R04]MBU3022147.1 flagellar biosynthesis anti-sigma factor FlgM [Aestuariibacter sp. A3R04]
MAINNVNGGGVKTPIDNTKLNNQQNQTQNTGQQEAAAKAQTAAAPRQDSVSLTQSAQQLNQVQKKGTEAPVNQEKVDKLKKAIQSGEYKIDPDSLAQKIARLEAQVFGLKS